MRTTLSPNLTPAAGHHLAWAVPRGSTLAMVAACTIWGTSFALGKIALRDLSVPQLILMRFALASLVLLPLLFRGWPHLTWRDVLLLFLTGILAVPVTFLLQFYGLAMTTVTRASLIIGTAPPMMALAGMVFFSERSGMRVWTAVALSLAGIAAIGGSPGAGGSWVGDGLVFLSIVTSVAWVLIIKRVSQRLTSLTATGIMIVFGTLTLFPVAWLDGGFPRLDLPMDVWMSVIGLGVLCTALAFVLWNWGLERTSAARGGLFLNIEPAVGALLGIGLLGDPFGAGVILGGALIIGAALWVGEAEQGTSTPSDRPSEG